ncbi:MAG TPA: two-component sensor histidine kinase [Flavobacteriales bacterium]|nr:two-component sensor histidine kinase [Crocinitomicaceae bacterium]HAE31312.1 two-component sensor histidine kinase [Flavobacteriales bacterium]
MKLSTPREVATFIAILIGAIVILVYSIVGFLVGQFNFIILACVGILSIVLSYILIFYSLEYFINKKIRLIYRTIRKHKLGPKSTKEFKMNEDILENVNKEVIDWAESSATQIAQLRKQETFRREYIGNLSHELKTPIFSIQGYILTLLEGGLEDESINRKFLERASKGVDRITKIVDDLDTITKLEEGRLNLETKKQDLVELAREVMESFEIKAGKRKIEVSFDQEYNKEIFVDMNRSGIGQVFTNLINNSLNYGKEEGRTEIRFHDMETQILIEVSDDGIGIAEDQLPRLFERFYRVDKSRTRNEGGTGLGLAIVKHIVDSHGQSINVRSTLGEGSTFSFTLKKA